MSFDSFPEKVRTLSGEFSDAPDSLIDHERERALEKLGNLSLYQEHGKLDEAIYLMTCHLLALRSQRSNTRDGVNMVGGTTGLSEDGLSMSQSQDSDKPKSHSLQKTDYGEQLQDIKNSMGTHPV